MAQSETRNLEKYVEGNYSTWAIRFMTVMEDLDLDDVFSKREIDLPAVDSAARIEFEKRNKAAFNKFLLCMPDNLLQVMYGFKGMTLSAKLAWAELRKRNVKGDPIARQLVSDEIHAFKILPSESMQEYLNRADALKAKVRGCEHPISDVDFFFSILRGLPSSYSLVSLLLPSDSSSWSREVVYEKLLQEETRRRFIGKSDDSTEAYLVNGEKGGPLSMTQSKGGESRFKGQGQAHFGKGKPAKFHGKGEWKTSSHSSQNSGHVGQKSWSNNHGQGQGSQGKKMNFACSYCKVWGHGWRFCKQRPSNWTPPKFESKKGHALMSQEDETDHCFEDRGTMFSAMGHVKDMDKDAWIVDSGCTNHMTPNLHWLKDLGPSTIKKVKVGNGEVVDVEAQGTVILKGEYGNEIKVCPVLYVPKMAGSLLSARQLDKKQFRLVIDEGEIQIWKKNPEALVATAKAKGELYRLIATPLTQPMPITKPSCDDEGDVSYVVRGESTNETKVSMSLLHKRMGHYNIKALWDMVQQGRSRGIQIVDGPKTDECHACLSGKMTRAPFSPSDSRAKHALDLVHTDVEGPMPLVSREGNLYSLLFLDDHTRWSWLHFIKHKFEVHGEFKKWLAKAERQTNKKLLILRSDNGGEYTSNAFKSEFEKLEHQYWY